MAPPRFKPRKTKLAGQWYFIIKRNKLVPASDYLLSKEAKRSGNIWMEHSQMEEN